MTPLADQSGVRVEKGRWIHGWRPDDPDFWAEPGRRIARRNLIWSILAEHLGFTVWTLWSVTAVKLGAWNFSDNQLFWIVALPNLIGSVARLPYAFAPARYGGRNWTVVSVLLLLIPAGLLALAVNDPSTPYWMFLVIAATAGLGGGNFASSMANITYFYPEKRQGFALGMNAAGGNLGVSSVQLLVPAVIGALGLAAAGLVWVPLILFAAIVAYYGMDNLATARSNVREQLNAAKRGQTWVLSILYIGTFGSFLGYATALPLLTKSQFPEESATRYAFLGAFVGSLTRPLGGWMADRFGGARVTFWNFLVMAVGVGVVWQAFEAHNFAAFLGSFLVLFVTAGIGNGSTYRMIPAIFRAVALKDDAPEQDSIAAAMRRTGISQDVLDAGKRESTACIGITSAIGACGGFFINRGFGTSIDQTGNANAALAAFAIFYCVCLFLTWWCYLRRRFASRLGPSFVDVGV